MHRLYQDTQATFADMTEVVRERMAGIRIVKAYTGEARSAAALGRISKTYISRNLALVRVTGFFFPMMMFFSNLSMVIVLLLGGRLTLTFTISGEYTHLRDLRDTLRGDRESVWFRHLLADALERLLKWATDSTFYRFSVVGGNVGELERGGGDD